MRKLVLLLFLVNLSYAQQEDKNLYLFLGEDYSYTTKKENDRELVETYHFYKEDATYFSEKKGGFSFIHKEIKKTKFENTERKFWNGKVTKVKNFDTQNKVIINKDWFNEYDEDLIFSFFYTNQNYNYYVVYFDEEDNLYWVKEIYFATMSPYNDSEDEEDTSKNKLRYELKLLNNTFVKVLID